MAGNADRLSAAEIVRTILDQVEKSRLQAERVSDAQARTAEAIATHAAELRALKEAVDDSRREVVTAVTGDRKAERKEIVRVFLFLIAVICLFAGLKVYDLATTEPVPAPLRPVITYPVPPYELPPSPPD